jgi:hypothetical protein
MSTAPDIITFETVLNDDQYTPRPGLTYEVAEGVRVKTKRHTVALVEKVEAVKEGEPDYSSLTTLLDPIIEQARLLVDVPAGFEWNRDTVDATVAQRMVDDFFSSVMVRSRLLTPSSPASALATNGSPKSEEASSASPA